MPTTSIMSNAKRNCSENINRPAMATFSGDANAPPRPASRTPGCLTRQAHIRQEEAQGRDEAYPQVFFNLISSIQPCLQTHILLAYLVIALQSPTPTQMHWTVFPTALTGQRLSTGGTSRTGRGVTERGEDVLRVVPHPNKSAMKRAGAISLIHERDLCLETFIRFPDVVQFIFIRPFFLHRSPMPHGHDLRCQLQKKLDQK